ncbi:hypothetical protein [Streptomyces sp. TRM 70361]|uniref:hypothetical protein n=1 Tax=Streptomyces sp. TRM 70361 TaxID=3116553 RepID=UPI003FCD8BBB
MLGAVRQLLQFGTDVEVLGPPEARTELARAAAGVHALYPRPLNTGAYLPSPGRRREPPSRASTAAAAATPPAPRAACGGRRRPAPRRTTRR